MKTSIQAPDGHIFKLKLSKEEIETRIVELGEEISAVYKDKKPIFLVILNGAFMFAADLMRQIDFDNEISFTRLKSYQGFDTTSNVSSLLGLQQSVENRDVIIVEDIIDSGNTITYFLEDLKKYKPKSIAVASFLVKPENLIESKIEVNFTGFELTKEFVIGYGMDYNDFGRHLPALYQLEK